MVCTQWRKGKFKIAPISILSNLDLFFIIFDSYAWRFWLYCNEICTCFRSLVFGNWPKNCFYKQIWNTQNYRNFLALIAASPLIGLKSKPLIYSILLPSCSPVHLLWTLFFLIGDSNEMFIACLAKCSPKSFRERVLPVVEALAHNFTVGSYCLYVVLIYYKFFPLKLLDSFVVTTGRNNCPILAPTYLWTVHPEVYLDYLHPVCSGILLNSMELG